MKTLKQLEQLFLDLEVGQTLREVCPQCGGGSTRELSLSITLDDSGYMLWHCFRASCGFSGKRLTWGVVHGHGATPKKRPKDFTGALETLPLEQARWLEDKFGLKAPQNWRWAPEYSRLYIPILGPTGKHRGAMLRSTINALGPKSLTFKEATEEPWFHWYSVEDNSRVVLVEDMFSAQKLQQSGIPCACLLGTHLGLDKVREILTQTDQVSLALDKDAYSKSIGYAVQYKHLLDFRVWKLERDLKYEPEERIIEAYYERKEDFSSSSQEP